MKQIRIISLCLTLLVLFSACSGQDRIAGTQTELPAVSVPEPEPVLPDSGTPDKPQTPSDEPQLSAEEQRIFEIVSSMTLEEKVGQMFLVRCPTAGMAEACSEYAFGGYVLFAPNIDGKDKLSLRQELDDLQAAADIDLLIAVDEEGGTVCRLSSFAAFRDSRFPSPAQLYAAGGWDAISNDIKEKCGLFREVGVNVNLAPVCDVVTDPSAFMYKRAFGGSAEGTAEYAVLCTTGYAEERIGAVLKHFPGYGNNADTHVDTASDNRTLEYLEQNDLLPFHKAIEAGASAIMVAHNIIACLDDEMPASLSPKVHAYLREEMGFDGVIVTDALDMGAISAYADNESAAIAAVLAGNDLLCCTDYAQQIPAVIQAVKDGTIPTEIIDSAVARILRWKMQLGIVS